MKHDVVCMIEPLMVHVTIVELGHEKTRFFAYAKTKAKLISAFVFTPWIYSRFSLVKSEILSF